MKYGLALALVFIGIWSIPGVNNLKNELRPAADFKQTDSVAAESAAVDKEGEVKGARTSMPSPSPILGLVPHPMVSPAATLVPTPELTPVITPTPVPVSVSTPPPSPVSTPTPTSTPTSTPLPIWKILDKPVMIKDETKTFKLPTFPSTTSYLLEIEYEFSSVEINLGFDEPALMIFIDDRLAYQQFPLEDGEEKTSQIKFNPRVFSDSPQKLQIWSGNQLDDSKQSSTVVKSIQLIPLRKPIFIETAMIQDFQVIADTAELFTLSWATPATTDPFLPKPLAYEIRYSLQPITPDTWSAANLIKIIQPQFFAPQAVNQEELALVQLGKTEKENLGNSTDFYFAIRSIDSLGELSAITQTSPY